MAIRSSGTCWVCGEWFMLRTDGTVPTHNDPPLTRQVCGGSHKHPRQAPVSGSDEVEQSSK